MTMKTNDKAATPATSTEPVLPIQTKHLAAQFGMKATALRRILRSMPAYADGVHTNYRWAENDKRIGDIEKQIKQLAAEKAARAQAAKAALQARTEKATKQAEVDAKAAPAKA